MTRAARRRTRQVVGQFLPSVLAGAIITASFVHLSAALVPLLPGLWAICFGIGTFASRPYLPRASGWVALFYYAAGIALLWMRAAARSRCAAGGSAACSARASCSPPRCSIGISKGQRGRRRQRWRRNRRLNAPTEPGRFAYDGLDRVLHEKARLGIMTSLVTRPEGLRFSDLKRLCALTDGNLSRHLDVLREAGLVEVWKGFENGRPQTLCRLSAEGRQRFVAYLEELEQVIRDAMPKAAKRAERAAGSAARACSRRDVKRSSRLELPALPTSALRHGACIRCARPLLGRLDRGDAGSAGYTRGAIALRRPGPRAVRASLDDLLLALGAVAQVLVDETPSGLSTIGPWPGSSRAARVADAAQRREVLRRLPPRVAGITIVPRVAQDRRSTGRRDSSTKKQR